jgi:hypothetical protein
MQIRLPVITQGSKARISGDPVGQMEFRQYCQLTVLCSSLTDKFHSPGEVIGGFEGLEDECIRNMYSIRALTQIVGAFSPFLCFSSMKLV